MTAERTYRDVPPWKLALYLRHLAHVYADGPAADPHFSEMLQRNADELDEIGEWRER